MLEATYDQEGTGTWANLYKVTTAQANQTAELVPSDLRPYLANGDPDPNFPYDFFAKRATPGRPSTPGPTPTTTLPINGRGSSIRTPPS